MGGRLKENKGAVKLWRLYIEDGEGHRINVMRSSF